ncbi:MAG TPA: thermonuclease family protein [archaeon]|nr:thermonuclease family protein [archaeon]
MERILKLGWRHFILVPALYIACQAAASAVAGKYPHYAGRANKIERSQIQVNDGDTFKAGSLTIRVLGLDTPEISSPEHGYFEDQPYGREAKSEAEKIFSEARLVEYVPYRNDTYGRLLAHVFVDGELFAVKMIGASLAYETVSFYGDNGFPDLAREIQRAAKKAGQPPFMEPYRWRRVHRRRD